MIWLKNVTVEEGDIPIMKCERSFKNQMLPKTQMLDFLPVLFPGS